jgi:hypothetical protein
MASVDSLWRDGRNWETRRIDAAGFQTGLAETPEQPLSACAPFAPSKDLRIRVDYDTEAVYVAGVEALMERFKYLLAMTAASGRQS